MEALEWVRVIAGVLFVALLALAIHRRARVFALLREFLLEAQPAYALGLTRAMFFGVLFYYAVDSPATWYASLSPNFVNLPPGWKWTSSFLPLSVSWTGALKVVLIGSTFLAALGLFSRTACIVTCLVGVYVYGVPAFYFKIGHGLHVPLLSAFVLAASPVGDGFSLDAVYRRYRGVAPPPSSVAYGLPIRFCWLLLGTMYLFPGLWKIWEAGDLYLDGTSIRAAMLTKWVDQVHYRPLLRPDKVPFVLALLGAGTLVLEVGFFFALFERRLRVIAGVGAAVFHVGIGVVTDIWFNPVHPLIVLIDFPWVKRLPGVGRLSALVERVGASLSSRFPVRESRAPSPAPPRSPVGTAFIGTAMVLSMFVAGTLAINSWPVSVYPKFAKRHSGKRSKATAFAYAIVSKDGSEREVIPTFAPMYDTSAMRRVIMAVRKEQVRGRGGDGRYLALIVRFVNENCGPFEPGDRLRIYQYDFRVDPDERDDKRRNQKLVIETEL